MAAPILVPLYNLPEGEVLTVDQWKTMMAIADTIIPSISLDGMTTSPSTNHPLAELMLDKYYPEREPEDHIKRYLDESASSTPAFKPSLERTLAQFIPKENLKGLAFMLSALRHPAGCLLLTGSTTAFYLQPIETRERILLGWRSSRLPPLRTLFKSLTMLCSKTWLSTSVTHPALIGFAKFPSHTSRNPSFDFEFITAGSGTDGMLLDTDVVVIGSGCGGGVCAKNLAEAGLRVLVVDKGYHFSTVHFPMDVPDAAENLFESGGMVLSDDGSILTIPGSCWGGGGIVNWSAALHTQNWVREEWARDGLPLFTSQEFQNSLDCVAERMGVSTKYINHNAPNRILLEGARRLGYPQADVPQNTGQAVHDCGYCMNGCATSAKQGPAVSFLPDAARAGAEFMEGFKVDRVIFEKGNAIPKATGVIGLWTSRDRAVTRQVKITAKRVIVSAGTLHSPLILQRSGLKNPQIGRNLHLHPVTPIRARYDEVTRSWEGSILTALVDIHHVKLECPAMLPYIASIIAPWEGGLDFKVTVGSFDHWVAFIALTRDRDSGRVYADPIDGRPRMSYTPSSYDTSHTLEGIIAGAKILYITGAREITSPNPLQASFIRRDESKNGDGPDVGINDKNFQQWIDELKRHGISCPTPCTMVSAHQMGTCRMSSEPRSGVVDEKGKVWGRDNLYVADASVFPSASGVNPMLTTMGICDWISRNIVKDFKGEGGIVDVVQAKL